MQQVRISDKLARKALLFTLSLAAVLGTALALGITGKSGDLRAAGTMPEVVATADQPRLTMDEIVVRAPRPGQPAGAADQKSGINQ